jgi:hypothetical protein
MIMKTLTVSYVWLCLISMRNDRTLTRKEAKKLVRADYRNDSSLN